MFKSRQLTLGIVLVAGLVLLAGVTLMSQATPAAAAPGTNPGAPWLSQYSDTLIANLAKRLNITVAQLNAAYTAAVGDTVNQAVQEGNLTQQQADEAKAAAGNGIGPALGKGGHGGFGDGLRGPGRAQLLDSAATALGLIPDQLQAELATGKSIATVAGERKVDLQKVRDAVLAALKTQLTTDVQNGRLTQAQADQQYNQFGQQIDQFLNDTHGPDGRHRNGQPQGQQP